MIKYVKYLIKYNTDVKSNLVLIFLKIKITKNYYKCVFFFLILFDTTEEIMLKNTL